LNRILSAFLVFLAIVLILLGGIFIIASGVENIVVGGVFVLIAALLLFYVYRSDKIEAARPKVMNQTFNVKMSGSGQLEQKQLTCRSCGAPLADKDLSIVSGGVMVKCPYCGSVYALEEAPKW
jgi:DNA-directed RNA polymerase subunit RPC12/RpoP